MTKPHSSKLPHEWIAVSVKELSQVLYGKALPADQRLKEGEVPVYASSGIVGKHNEALHTGPSIVIGRKGTVGAIYYVPKDFWCIDTAFYLDNISSAVDIEYLSHALRMLNLSRLSIVVAIPGINRRDIENQQIPLPPLPEQRRIVAILREADELCRLRKEALEKANKLSSALFYEKFGDPATNPKKWPEITLSKMGNLDRGRSQHRPRNAPHLYGGPYPFVQTGDVAIAHGWITEYTQTYSEDGLAQSKLWPKGTLCITIAANIARTAILTFDACFPDSVVGFVPRPDVSAEYVRQWFVTFQGRLEALAPQAAQKNINLEILRNLRIPCPPETLHDEFAEEVARLYDVTIQQSRAGIKFDDLFQSLLARAFSGELTSEWREGHKDELAIAAEQRDAILGLARKADTRSPRIIELPEPILRNVLASVDYSRSIPLSMFPRPSGLGRSEITDALSYDQQRVFIAAHDATGHFTPESLAEENDLDPITVRRGLEVLAAAGLVMPVKLVASSPDGGAFYFSAFRLLRSRDDATGERPSNGGLL